MNGFPASVRRPADTSPTRRRHGILGRVPYVLALPAALVALAVCAVSAAPIRRRLLLHRAWRRGAVARGRCTARWAVDTDAQGRTSRTWRRAYEFTPAGAARPVVLEETGPHGGDPAPGAAVGVRHLPSRPEFAVVARPALRPLAGQFAVVCGALAVLAWAAAALR